MALSPEARGRYSGGNVAWEPWDQSQEGIEAARPEGLPVPANADARYEELDGG